MPSKSLITPLLAVAALTVAALAAAPRVEAASPPEARTGRIPVLVLTGENQTDWRWTSTKLRQLLVDSGKFEVEISIYPDGFLANSFNLEKFDLIVLDYDGPRFGAESERHLLETVRAGTGILAIHGAGHAFRDWEEYRRMLGYTWREDAALEDLRTFGITITDQDHPVTKGVPPPKAHADRLVCGLEPVADTRHRVLATVRSDAAQGGSGEVEPVLVAGAYGEGRVVQTSLGHVWLGDQRTWSSWEDVEGQHLLIRAAEWAATGAVTPVRRIEPNTLTDADRAAGWRLLFDGKSMQGWRAFGEGLPEESWRVENGALRVMAGGAANLSTVDQYETFEMEIEWRVGKDVDPGSLFSVGHSNEAAGMGYRPFDADQAARILRPSGEYNHARVVARLDGVEHWLNGVHVLTFPMTSSEWAHAMSAGNVRSHPEFSQLPLGRVALEQQDVDVWFRNVKIRPLIPPAVEQTRAVEPVRLFNGRDLSGWTWVPLVVDRTDLADIFHVEDGMLVCAGLPYGYLRTEAMYTSFVLTLDWRFDPVTRQAGNGGVLIRIQSPDRVWPYGIEVDLESNKVGDLWHYHDYPVTPHRWRTRSTDMTLKTTDAENRVGEWNHLEVQMVGEDLTVLSNGQVVNHLEGVMAAPGHIGIAAQDVAIQYRDLELRPLP